MIEMTLGWLVEQHTPLWAFLIAAFTSPTTWTKRATGWLQSVALP